MNQNSLIYLAQFLLAASLLFLLLAYKISKDAAQLYLFYSFIGLAILCVVSLYRLVLFLRNKEPLSFAEVKTGLSTSLSRILFGVPIAIIGFIVGGTLAYFLRFYVPCGSFRTFACIVLICLGFIAIIIIGFFEFHFLYSNSNSYIVNMPPLALFIMIAYIIILFTDNFLYI